MSTVDGTSGDDILGGGDGQVVNGGQGDDLLFDTTENGGTPTRLNGGEGNDTLNAAAASSRLAGGTGSDTYIFSGTVLENTAYVGDLDYGGTIFEVEDSDPNNLDVLVFSGDITPEDAVLIRRGNDVEIHFQTLKTPTNRQAIGFDAFHPIIIADFFESEGSTVLNNTLERIEFSDGQVWDSARIAQEALAGLTYEFTLGDGDQDVFVDNIELSSVEEIVFGTGISPADLSFEEVRTDNFIPNSFITDTFLIHIDSEDFGRETITLVGLSDQGGLNSIRFADGTIWDAQQVIDEIVLPFSTFEFNLGDGSQDVNLNPSGLTLIERINFGENITPADISVERTSSSNVLIHIDSSEHGRETLTIDRITSETFIPDLNFIGGDTITSSAAAALTQLTTDGDDVVFEFDQPRSNSLNVVIDGGLGDDSLTAGTDSFTTFLGGDGNDTLVGNRFEGAENTFIGGRGDDEFRIGPSVVNLIGGEGNDTYFFNNVFIELGYGGQIDNSASDSESSTDVLRFDAPSTIFQFFLTPNGNIEITTEHSQIPLVIEDFINHPIDNIIFSDGVELASQEVLDLAGIAGTNANDVLEGTIGDDIIAGRFGEDTITGLEGDDFIDGEQSADLLIGGPGDDTLVGDDNGDTLIGGIGDDLLQGGVGSATYVFSRGHGQDTIEQPNQTFFSSRSTNIITFSDINSPAQFSFFRFDDDLIILSRLDDDSITIRNQFPDQIVDLINLDNGVSLAIEDIADLINTNLFEFSIGDGSQTFSELGAIINFGEGIERDNLSFESLSNDSFAIHIDSIESGRETLLIENVTIFGSIPTIRFSNGDLFDRRNISLALVESSDNDDVIFEVSNQFGVIDSDPDNQLEVIDGGAGNDFIAAAPQSDVTLIGGDGNDTLIANPEAFNDPDRDRNILIGGSGDDELRGGLSIFSAVGGEGSDNYRIAEGSQLYGGFIDNRASDSDTAIDTLYIPLRFDFNPEDFRVARADSDSIAIFHIDNPNEFSSYIIRGFDDNLTSPLDQVIFTRDGEIIEQWDTAEIIRQTFLSANSGIVFDLNFNTVLDRTGNSFTVGDLTFASLDGAAGDDEIEGTESDDVIRGLAGNDTLDGAQGNDLIIGGLGSDIINGGLGDDTLDGSEGNDFIVGGLDSDTINGGAGDDTLIAGLQEAALRPLGAIPVTTEEASNISSNLLNGGEGDDVLYATTQIPNFSTATEGDTLNGGVGNDTLFSSNPSDASNSDVLNGGEGDDVLHTRGEGGEVAHELNGGAGNDTFVSEFGRVSINFTGGEGNDVYEISANAVFYGGVIDNRSSGIGSFDRIVFTDNRSDDFTFQYDPDGTVTLTPGPLLPDTSTQEGTPIVIQGFDQNSANLISFNDNVTLDVAEVIRRSLLNEASSIIDTNNASTTISGSDNDDVIINNALGRDTLNGGEGNDTLFSSATFSGGDVLNGGAGDDVLFDQGLESSIGTTLNGGEGNDSLFASAGSSRLNGGLGSDQYFFDADVSNIFRNINDTNYGGVITELADTDPDNEDILHLGGTITPADVTFVRIGNDLQLHIGRTPREAASQPAFAPLVISQYFDDLESNASTGSIETIIFSDGTQWGGAEIQAAALGDLTHSIDITQGNATVDVERQFNSRTNIIDFGDLNLQSQEISFERDIDSEVLFITIDRPEAPNGQATITVVGFTGSELNSIVSAGITATGDSLRQLIVDNGDGLSGFDNIDDTITGSDNADLIQGLTGDDTLNGGIGNDTIYAESETAYTSDASGVTNNLVNGGAGDDLLYTSRRGNSNDTLNGGEGNDLLFDNPFEGASGRTQLNGGAGDDTLVSGFKEIAFNGGAGSDTYEIGNDAVAYGGVINNFASDNTTVIDTIRFTGVASTAFTFTRNDVGDILLGGVGSDPIVLQGFDSNPNNRVIFADDVELTVTEILALTLQATDGDDEIIGFDTDDVLSGLGGNDSLNGGAGNDLLQGGLGNDTLEGGIGNDTLVGGDGDDLLSINDVSTSDAGSFLDGGEGNDTLLSSDFDEANNTFGNDILNGGGGNDELRARGEGFEVNHQLNGGEGDDTLYAEFNLPTLAGGEGNDNYIYTTGVVFDSYGGLIDNRANDAETTEDTIHFDTYDASILNSLDFSITSDGTLEITNLADPQGIGVLPTLHVIGFAENPIDRIIFNDGVELTTDDIIALALEGSNSDDEIIGFNTGDILGYDGNDVIEGGLGNDTLLGQGQNDTLRGGVGDDLIIGGAGDDDLSGGSGNDTLEAGSGNDFIFAGGGDDTVIFRGNFETVRVNNNDSIGATNIARFEDVSIGQLWFSQSGDDLVVTVIGTTNQAIFRNWFGGNLAAPLDQLLIGEDILLPGAIDALVAITANSGIDAASLQVSGAESLIPEPLFIELFNAANDLFVDADSSELAQVIDETSGATDQADIINGDGGDDEISGGAGDDTINGGADTDFVLGGAGDDVLLGGSGDDGVISGGAGNDLINGGDDDDFLRGGSGNDTYVFDGDFGQDRIGNSGASVFDVDVIRFDSLQIEDLWLSQSSSNNDLIIYQVGTDNQVIVRDWFNTLGDFRVEEIQVGSRRLFVDNGDFQTLLDEMARLLETNPLITLEDIIANGTPENILELLRPTLDSVWQQENSLDGADILVGSAADDVLNGFGGNDQLEGDTGNDRLDGGSGNDDLIGGSGNDQLLGGEGDDDVSGGVGDDTLIGGQGNDFLSGNNGDDVYLFEGDFGQDRINNHGTLFQRDEIQLTDVSIDQIWLSQSGQDLLITIAGSDNQVTVRSWFSQFTTRSVDEITADGFTLHAGDVAALLAAQEATGLSAADVAANGIPEAVLSSLQPVITEVFVPSDELNFRGVDIVTGSDEDESFITLAGNDSVRAGAGNDTLDGGAGQDDLIAGAGDDVIIAGAGDNDLLAGGQGNDTYLFSGDFGRDRVDNNGGFNDVDVARFTDDIGANQLWFSQNNNDLEVNVLDLNESGDLVTTSNTVVVRNWFAGSSREVDLFEVDGLQLANENVAQLIQALSSFDIPQGAGQVVSQEARDALELAIASPNSWQ